jgi:hypothetical protein
MWAQLDLNDPSYAPSFILLYFIDGLYLGAAQASASVPQFPVPSTLEQYPCVAATGFGVKLLGVLNSNVSI